ncbi:MAG: hypothetical protein PHU05_03990 [Bacilli bacterium]|nr:hypothetical protein [Bacilli bacterium]
MKVIDLLNIKFCGNELPKQIKYNQKIFTKKGNGISDDVYYCSDDDDYEISHYINLNTINDEIEIIEEDKPIEKLDYEINENNVDTCTEKIRCKINEIIDKLNKLEKENE